MVAVHRDTPTAKKSEEPEEDQTRDLPPDKLPLRYKRAVPANFPPKEFDRYKFVRELGRGSMGQVYVYRETGAIDREVAIKFQRESDAESASRFHTEARIAASLQHPNVVTVFADGEYNGIPYIVFEYLDGESLDKLREPMPWTEVRKLGLQLASGLAAVHSAGLLHRDIKPANSMLLDRGGQQLVKLIDFGVAKSSDAARNLGGSTGTPRYMAPEVWDSGRPTERSDVYSLGLTLYQLCTGVKPPVHPYDDDVRLEHPDIDSAFSDVVNRCLERDPQKRYASGSELYSALLPLYSVRELMDIDVQQWLRNDRADGYLWTGRKLQRAADLSLEGLPDNHREFLTQARQRARSTTWRKRALALMMVLLIVAMYMGVRYANQAALDRKVDSHLEEAGEHLRAARDEHQVFDNRRTSVLDEFSRQGNNPATTEAWRSVASLEPKVDQKYRAAGQKLEIVLALDPSRGDVRGMLADVLEARARLASATYRLRELSEHLERLSVYDEQAYERWIKPVPIAVTTQPANAHVTIEAQKVQQNGTILSKSVASEFRSPFSYALEPGSYILTVQAEGDHIEVLYPFVVAPRANPMDIEIVRPGRSQVPSGFVYIPKGNFLYGYGSWLEDEHLREWYDTIPIMRRTLDAYLISRYETTYRQWLEFLDSVCISPGCADQPGLIPRGDFPNVHLELQYTDDDRWRFVYSTGEGNVYSALEGEKFVHGGRTGQWTEQDWLDFPVSAIAPKAALRYVAWLNETRRIPRARLCSEFEWERAARGADMRTFPHGDVLEPMDANIDRTHGSNAHSTGPDVVGTHPRSRSPFGVEDMSGNVFEMTKSPFSGAEFTVRSGAFYLGARTAKVVNRWIPPQGGSPLVGIRLCADIPKSE